jgi:LacI family transcriptional regulator
VDAVLVVSGGDNHESITKLCQSNLAVLTLDPHEKSSNSIYSDSYVSIRRSCKYLYDLGHKKIAFINGSYTNFIGRERLRAYLDFMHEKGLEPMYLPDRSNESYSYEEGHHTMKLIFETYGLPEAVCSVSDLMAVGAINYLNTHGFSVPHDVSVIGFDDLQVCEIVTPKLTTVRQNYEAFGELACQTLMGMIEGKVRTIDPIVVDTEIVVRDSCKKRT